MAIGWISIRSHNHIKEMYFF